MRLSVPKLTGLVVLSVVLTLVAVAVFSDGEKHITRRVEHLYDVASPDFVRSMGVLLGPSLVGGNRTETLLNGDQIFPSMLQAIGSAKRTIDFETYIYWSGRTGQAFADALSERARNGVKVHILVDWVGSQKMDNRQIDQMKAAGVDVRRYHPLHWYTIDRINNRTHRKLLVVDGRIGFTGGVGIADEWTGHAQDPDHWRDTHFRIEGPAVAQMQAAFIDNWTKVSGAVLHGPDYFPPIEPRGGEYAQVFKSSVEGGSESTHLMYLMAIAGAAKSIDLAMAYFVPDEVALQALEAAMKRGVKVRIILPGKHTDASFVRRASRSLWGRVLAGGAHIHEYEPTMYHCKVLIVDELFTSVGSTNFDPRSFRLNDEANLNIYDHDFALRQRRDFENDLKRSRRITFEEWANRPWHEKSWERIAALLGPQL